jgi:hypothetical protein
MEEKDSSSTTAIAQHRKQNKERKKVVAKPNHKLSHSWGFCCFLGVSCFGFEREREREREG